jgi:hypothetical protein
VVSGCMVWVRTVERTGVLPGELRSI